MYQPNGVCKNFRKDGHVVRALDGIDLTIGDGEFLAIQGPTGQGKTTLLFLLGALGPANRRTVDLQGPRPEHPP